MSSSELPTIDWLSILPMIIVAATGGLALVFEMLAPKRNNNVIVGICLVGLGVAVIPLLLMMGHSVGPLTADPTWNLESFGDMVVRDAFGSAIQFLVILSAFLSILFSEGYLREKRVPFGEFYPLLLWSACGAMIMSSSRNLLMIFLGLEVLSISLYVMAGMSRSEEKSEESALKYFLLGAFASGFLLYGIAFIYGATGSVHLAMVKSAWLTGDPNTQTMLIFGMALMLIGLSFKSAFVPFHQWTPDVYQGAPTNVTAFMAAGSKIGAIGALWRVLEGTEVLSAYWMPALFWIAILTMTVGNLIALAQKDVKRILGYSSIAHAGYILVGVLAHFKAPEIIGTDAVTYYLLSYALMTIGSFAVISLAAKGGKENTGLESLHGLWRRSPLAAGSLVVFMISLVGMPPSAGFVGKFLIFRDAINSGLTPLALVLAVNSIISIYYYLGIARAAFVWDEDEAPVRAGSMNFGLVSACLICAAGVFLVTFLYTPITGAIGIGR